MLWREAALRVEQGSRVLIVDDSALDKPYAKKVGAGATALDRVRDLAEIT